MKTTISNYGRLSLLLLLCAGFTSCNKDDFYQKDSLIPEPETTGTVDSGSQGGVDSGVGSTQGGVEAGVAGGTEGGATTGSSTTGGTDGSTAGGATAGSTTGGTDGSTTGGTTGSTTGGTTGGTTGSTTGTTTGGTTGSTTGGTVYDCNNGHGNDADGVDESNPGAGSGGPNAEKDAWIAENCKMDTFAGKSSQQKLDVMWIVDNSRSMEDEQDALGTNFNAFINEFIDTDVDFKMAITTTDTSSYSLKGRMVTGSDIKLTSAKAKENANQFMADFKSLVQVGTSGSGYEKGLAASEGFMQKYSSSFIRPDAYLAVIVVTDEDDQSAKTPVEYVNFLKSFKANAGLVKVYSICDSAGTNTGSGITTGCARYASASNASSGTVSNIRNDFHASLSQMGDSLINLLDSFALSQAPAAGTLVVSVNGSIVTEYTYNSASRSIKFNAGHVPDAGAVIKVSYQKK